MSSLVVTADALDRMAGSLRAATLDQLFRALPVDDRSRGGVPITSSDSLRVGMDLVPVADVAESVERLGRRYLYRVFTPHERACARLGPLDPVLPIDPGGMVPMNVAGRSPVYSMQSLAGRFAAKEAALKVLRPRGARPEWRSIEVHRVQGGWCELRLSGVAALLAADAGIDTLAVSVTHEPMMAAACVVAMSRGGSRRHVSSAPAP